MKVELNHAQMNRMLRHRLEVVLESIGSDFYHSTEHFLNLSTELEEIALFVQEIHADAVRIEKKEDENERMPF